MRIFHNIDSHICLGFNEKWIKCHIHALSGFTFFIKIKFSFISTFNFYRPINIGLTSRYDTCPPMFQEEFLAGSDSRRDYWARLRCRMAPSLRC